jgi:LysM repeat protein
MKNKVRKRHNLRIRSLQFLPLILITILTSCRASKHIVPSTYLPATENAYIDTYKDIAVSEMKRTGIPASITLAQGMIESDEGRSSLAKDANNHFGIKCHNDWTGAKVYHDDDKKNECFRRYSKPEDSYYDHSDFLRSVPRYSFLFTLSRTDYKGWAHGLKKAGYATNPAYDNMLIRTIEEKNLHYFDTDYKPALAGQKSQIPVKKTTVIQDTGRIIIPVSRVDENNLVLAHVPRVMENNKLKYIIVRDGDTREKIEEEFQLLGLELSRYNDLKNDFTISPGQILYIQPKKEKAETGKDFYTTVDGDTMYLISQRYGIKLKSLYKMNRMEYDTEPATGSIIWLRSVRPVN